MAVVRCQPPLYLLRTIQQLLLINKKDQWLEFLSLVNKFTVGKTTQNGYSVRAIPTQVKKGGWVSVNPRILFIYNGYLFCCLVGTSPVVSQLCRFVISIRLFFTLRFLADGHRRMREHSRFGSASGLRKGQ